MQLKIEINNNIVVKWIPYNQFNNVKKVGKNGFATALWKDGLLIYNKIKMKHERIPNIEVTLKCSNVISNLLNEV
jgi:hypothetical protein